MDIKPEVYEKLGTFYLGRGYDIGTKQMDDSLVLYDSKDLVTHGVVLGMTGSGKTGLCLALLEEAAMDNIPVIAIDPKGDIANFLLTFPNLSADEFKPWVNEDDAKRKGQSVDDFAASQAQLWQKGLGDWGQSAERIKRLRDQTDITIFTPGSSAGIPVSIVASLAAPAPEVMEDAEIFTERVQSCVASLLSLAGVEGDPVQSPEHILLANIFTTCWQKGQDLTLEALVKMTQQPPFKKVGVVTLDDFLPEKKRAALAMKLNNLIASPSFAAWLQGVPLDIQNMLYTKEGKPRVSIFSIAHLGDNERMFFVSLLLTQLLGWMRAQSGTTSLRAMFYMDEIFGYLPPTAMPPSKKPMMILLKQARAFGLGMLLATQNPVDLDYKALSNMGTWWIGRLQTERDKNRLLDGLEGAAAAQNAKFDRSDMEKMMSALGNRIFLMNNVHEDHPVVFQVRWCMSYLPGPLSRNQIKTLMDAKRDEFEIAGVKPAATAAKGKAKAKDADDDDGFTPPSAKKEESDDAASDAGSALRPQLPDGTPEYFMPAEGKNPSYQPALLRSATVLYIDEKKKINSRVNVTVANVIDTANSRVDWDKFCDVPRDIDLSKLDKDPADGASFGDLPAAAQKAATYTKIAKDFPDWIYANVQAEVFYSPLLEAYSNVGESQQDFRARVTQTARELRDKAVEDLRTKLGKQAKSIQDDLQSAFAKLQQQKAAASGSTLSTVAQIGVGVLGALLGRKGGSLVTATTLNKAGTAYKDSKQAGATEAQIEDLKNQLKGLDAQLDEESKKIDAQYDPGSITLETTKLQPQKKNITVNAVGILWTSK